jgi:hypothetical protein
MESAMLRIVRVVPVLVVVLLLLPLGSRAAFAQDGGDTVRAIAATREAINAYQRDARLRSEELGRKLEILGDLTDAADSVTPMALAQSLSRARQKVEDARKEAAKDPALGEPVGSVVDSLRLYVTNPPFGMPADQLRAGLFVELGRLEEDILHQSATFQSEAELIATLANNLGHIKESLRAAAVQGGRASLATRRKAIKSGG